MNTTFFSASLPPLGLFSILLAAIPLCYLAAALMPTNSSKASWALARVGSGAAVVIAIALAVVLALSQSAVVPGITILPLGELGALTLSLRADALTAVMLVLVSFIGWIIVGYSQTYLAGEPRQTRYIRALMLTLALVSIVVVSNNLLMLAIAWLGTSLALHQLLTFYKDRPQAQIAAHKKFLASRVADVCIFAAVFLIAGALGSLEIDEILSRASALPALSTSLQVAVALIAITALLKCAQLPLHGWLIQVMEAPTPVSALLHAGVVNLGGFVLIRLSALIVEVPLAQTLLVVVGGLTACVAALVMMTRICIKVMLAWSTCAQMGFMLMQCGLGAYELALLHLVAHSLYKAHAFLGAGGAVAQSRLKQMTPNQQSVSLLMNIVAACFGALMVFAAAFVWNVSIEKSHALIALSVIVCMALAPLLSSRAASMGGLWPMIFIASAFVVAMIYLSLHYVFAQLVSVPSHNVSSSLVIFVLVTFALLFMLQSLIHANPQSGIARRLYPVFYHGLYLDELFTRLTFRLWPMKNNTYHNIDATTLSEGNAK